MSESLRKIAKSIAKDLLTGGNPERGQRLQIKLAPNDKNQGERDGGGYCEEAIITVIERHLTQPTK